VRGVNPRALARAERRLAVRAAVIQRAAELAHERAHHLLDDAIVGGMTLYLSGLIDVPR